MVLLFTEKITPRITYVCKHIFTRILGVEVSFTNTIAPFLAFEGTKISYGKQPLGNEFFIKSQGLLGQQGIESIDITVKDFKTTKCFFQTNDAGSFPFDIFAASFYLLSRYEEYLPHVKDTQGRFTAKESIAYKHQFLKQPIVDIWAYELKNLLLLQDTTLSLSFKTVQQRILIDAAQPFKYKQKGFLRSLFASLQDVVKGDFEQIVSRFKVLMSLETDPYDSFEKIILLSKTSKTPLIFFFQLGSALHYEKGTNVNRKIFRLLVKYVADYNNVGAVLSHKALYDFTILNNEKKQLENITNTPLLSTTNTQLQLNLPDTYRDLVSIEVENDYTMTYPNKIGFRAGTCTPFLFYDLDHEIITPLVLHPVAITTDALKNSKPSTIFKEIEILKNEVSKVNGHFNVLFKNSDFTHKTWGLKTTQLLQNML